MQNHVTRDRDAGTAQRVIQADGPDTDDRFDPIEVPGEGEAQAADHLPDRRV
nr:hypothetical protein [Streptomyces ruber]